MHRVRSHWNVQMLSDIDYFGLYLRPEGFPDFNELLQRHFHQLASHPLLKLWSSSVH